MEEFWYEGGKQECGEQEWDGKGEEKEGGMKGGQRRKEERIGWIERVALP